MSTQSKLLPAFAAGFLAAGLAWAGVLEFISDKPVPNAVFTQTIVDAKLNAAKKTGGEARVTFTGGSNVLFGIDSRQFSEETGRPSINFGCAAGMGPELILNLVKPSLRKNDVVVLCWEYGQYAFTRSGRVNLTYLNLLFGPQQKFLNDLPVGDRLKLSLSLPASHVRQAIATSFNPYVKAAVYRCPWTIDSGGNIRSNKIKIITDAELKRQPLSSLLTETVITKDVNGILSEFVRDCREREVQVLASWPNTFAHPDYIDNPTVTANFATIKSFWKSLQVPVVGRPEDAMLAAEFFHDTYYHLNSKGVAVRSSALTKDLKPWLTEGENRTAN